MRLTNKLFILAFLQALFILNCYGTEALEAGKTALDSLNEGKTEIEMKKSNFALTQQLKDQEKRRIADSTAARSHGYKSGYINISEIGAGLGLGDTDPDFSRSLFSINNVFGYGINRNFLGGVGVGVNFYNGGAMLPLYIDLRYTFKEKSITPFLVADGGFMISLDKFNEGGIFVNPMIGVKRKLNDKFSFHLSAGGLVQRAPAGSRNSFINFKGGVSFKK